ncbi:MAG: ComF family protein [Deltaproteobacteria bacterium]|nr:ComF family protein [Deltaproteobacteria bacterium]
MVRRSFQSLAELVWPSRCAACEALGEEPFCRACAGALLECPPGCPVCGQPQDEALLPALIPRRCARCSEEPPLVHTARAPYVYWGPLADAIAAFKYRGHEHLARPLSSLLVATQAPRVDALVPIPLHSARLRSRGFDQALLLARHASDRLRVPMLEALERVRATRPQVGLSRNDRRANVRGAFTVREKVEGRAVCLIDDVYTTGATAEAAALSLLNAGARRVELRTLARA